MRTIASTSTFLIAATLGQSIFTAVLLGAASIANAETPQVPSEAPYIVLSENHDEPNGYALNTKENIPYLVS